MAEEIKNEQTEQQEQPQLQGWKDVNITPDMPLSAIIQFCNILNQRLATVENLVSYTVDDETISLTEAYRRQTEAELAAQEEQAKNESKAN